MAAGLIYAAIVAVWAAFLLPLWLRRHDEDSAQRSAEQFSSAMRVLARRQQAASGGSGSGSGQAGVWSEDSDQVELGEYEFARSGPSPATRRRRVLVGLLAVSSVLAALAAAELVPWWSWYVSLVVVAGFVGLSSWIASGERAVADARIERFRQVRDQMRYAEVDGMAEGYRGDAFSDEAFSGASSGASEGSDVVASDPGVAAEGAASGSEPVVAVLPDDFGKPPRIREDGTWDPIEVPLPTYVTKDAAPRTSRKIQLGDAPEHRSLLDESESGQPATTGIRDELYDREQTGDFDDLRAVND